jgi:hypothetical protein
MTSPAKPQDNSPAKQPTDLREWIPALHLLRASGLAIDPRKMFLGGLALVLLAAGDWSFDSLPVGQSSVSSQAIQNLEPNVIGRGLSYAGFLPQQKIESWLSVDAFAFSLLTPIRTVVEPGRVLFQTGNTWSSIALAWTQLLWALIVWSFIGGALCRMNALQFATKKRISIVDALRFSRRQLLSYLIAPLLPLSAVLILLGFNWLLGLVASPSRAIAVVEFAIGWGIVLFCGFLMTMLLLGISSGWPLMIAAISTEDSDGFDGLSRAFGYLFDRPWNAAFLAVCSLPVFATARILLAILIGLTISLGSDAVVRGLRSETTASEISVSIGTQSSRFPPGHIPTELDGVLTGTGSFLWPETIPSKALIAWTCIPALLYVGFGPSFFWAATTVSYFLLRRSDDGTPLDSVVDWPEKTDSDQTAAAQGVLEEPASDSES